MAELLEAAWDLAPLVDGDEAHGFDRLLDEAIERALSATSQQSL